MRRPASRATEAGKVLSLCRVTRRPGVRPVAIGRRRRCRRLVLRVFPLWWQENLEVLVDKKEKVEKALKA